MKKSKKLFAVTLLALLPALTIGLTGCKDDPEEPTPVEPTTISVTGVSLGSSESLSLTEGDTHQLTATVTPANATNQKVTFSSSDASKVSVSESGLLTALQAGTATITVTTEDGGFTASVVVNVAAAHVVVNVTDVTFASLNVTIEEGEEFNLNPQFTPTNATNKNIQYVSDTPAVAIVENNKVKGLAEGNAVITATALGAEEGHPVVKTINVRVNMAKLPLTVSAINVPSFYASYLQRTNTLDNVENITGNVDSGENYRNTYYKNEQGTADLYKVGNLNPFKFHVTASGTDEDLNETVVNDPFVEISLERYVEGAYQAVSEASTYVVPSRSVGSNTIDTFQFTEAAKDQQFKVTIEASDYAYEEVESSAKVSVEFQVVEAYNVYDLAGLSLFDNRDVRPTLIERHNNTVGDPWENIRPEGFANVPGLVLHSDITITTEDIPEAYLCSEEYVDNYIANYSDDFDQWIANKNSNLTLNGQTNIDRTSGRELLIGSVIDHVTVFHRITKEGEKFTFEGNYFTINYSGIKQIYEFNNHMQDGKMKKYQTEDGSHGQFFGWNCTGNWEQYTQDQVDQGGKRGGGETVLKNLTVRGNGDFSTEDKYAGGLMMYKVGATKFSSVNCISSNTFTTFITQNMDPSHKDAEIFIDRAKNYGSYNSMYYAYGSQVNKISNSYLEDAGGALFLLDETNYAAVNRGPVSTAYVDCENCHLENWITGQEPWFVGHNASALTTMMVGAGIPDIPALSINGGILGKNAAAHNGKSVVKLDTDGMTPLLNMITIDMCGFSPLTNKATWVDGDNNEWHGQPLEGRFTVNNGTDNQFKMDLTKFTNTSDPDYPALNAYNSLYAGLAAAGMAEQGLMFHSQGGGHAMLFPDQTNGLTYMTSADGQTPYGLSGYTTDATFNYVKNQVNTAMGTTIINDYSVDTLDGMLGTSMGTKLATGNYMSVYVIASAGSYPISCVVGMCNFQ